MRFWIIITALAVLTAPLWAADFVVDGGPYGSSPAVSTPALTDQSTVELKWDNGQRRWSVAWYTGAGYWVGNDFDISTLDTSYVKILKYKYYTRGAWPNQGWEGMRFGIYSFGGGVPGSRLWPTSGGGYFWKVNAGINAHIWAEFDINWTCPSVKFLPAQEQFYNYPQCDPFSLDNNTSFVGHSWEYSQGTWKPFPEYSNLVPYRNLMIRVWVETGVEYPGVEPSSLGRVKALYY
ncbi:MAG: hypothetical protein JSU81_09060 [Candidatus Coatesbacteria bacterium]|nr:MAG: hypothetical protein JSU81_09060 [Candidatus Coatesbacteria bacterium]